MITPRAEGVGLLDRALRQARPGPYQVQAAIAACHVTAARAMTFFPFPFSFLLIP